MLHKIFLSYSSVDRSVADAVCNQLELSGIKCWMAPRDIVPGEIYAKCLLNAINSSKLFVLIFSSDADHSEQVQKEVDRAIHAKLPIIPFKIDNLRPSAAMEYYLCNTQWLDAYSGGWINYLDKLVETCKMTLDNNGKITNPIQPKITTPTPLKIVPPLQEAPLPPPRLKIIEPEVKETIKNKTVPNQTPAPAPILKIIEKTPEEKTKIRKIIVTKSTKAPKTKHLIQQITPLLILLLVIIFYKDKILTSFIKSPATKTILSSASLEKNISTSSGPNNTETISETPNNDPYNLKGKTINDLDNYEEEILKKSGIIKDIFISRSRYEKRLHLLNTLQTKQMSVEDYNILSAIDYNKNVYEVMSLVTKKNDSFKNQALCLGPAVALASEHDLFHDIFVWELISAIENRLLYDDKIKTVKTVKFFSQPLSSEKFLQVWEKSKSTILIIFKKNFSTNNQITINFSSFESDLSPIISKLETLLSKENKIIIKKMISSTDTNKIPQITISIDVPPEFSTAKISSATAINSMVDLIVEYERLIHSFLLNFLTVY